MARIVRAGDPCVNRESMRSPWNTDRRMRTIAPIQCPAASPRRLQTGSAIFDVVRNFDDVAGRGIIRCGKDTGVRHDRNGRSDWSSSFRLIIDDVPRAPTNLLDEVVASESAKDGEVVFELPVSVKDVVLQIGSGDDLSRLPFKLP